MVTPPVMSPTRAETVDAVPSRVRYAAGIVGGALVAAVLQTVIRHPAQGWVAAVLLGAPMVWLIQLSRTGRLGQTKSLGWYGAWYLLFSAAWLSARMLEGAPPGERLGPQASIGVFLGSVALVGCVSRFPHWRLRFRPRRGSFLDMPAGRES